MQYPVDVTASFGGAAAFWSRYAIIFLAVVPPAVGAHGHVMKQTIKIVFTNQFSQFLLQKFSNQQAIITLKMINKMFNKTI